jgi:hypothetical protein
MFAQKNTEYMPYTEILQLQSMTSRVALKFVYGPTKTEVLKFVKKKNAKHVTSLIIISS